MPGFFNPGPVSLALILRIVLGDWYAQGSVLRVSPQGRELGQN